MYAFLVAFISHSSPMLMVALKQELNVAHLTARLPILAIVGGQNQCPKVTKEAGASPRPIINSALEVKWPRAAAVIVGIHVGALTVIAVSYWSCRHTLIPDKESFILLARLLKDVVADDKMEGKTHAAAIRSAHTGKEIADALGELALRYGNKWRGDGGAPGEAGIWVDGGDVHRDFPQVGKYV